ncbi:MAG: GntG family PLP-dependent aldolase [candidate division WOR-3 bacterium]
MKFIDLRSDTVTKPTPEMRKAMFEAEVGDDVLGEDPTVKELERLAADMFGKEEALFFPSGSMANATAVKVHTNEGDEVIVEERSHIYLMEMGHLAFISRVIPRPVGSYRGNMDLDEIKKAIRGNRPYVPKTSLICIENTHNYWGGAVVDIDNIKSIWGLAKENGLKVHIDGARIFNASAHSGISVKEYAKYCDSLMFSLSKGLCAPIGSMLVGSKDFIEKARRIRKLLGGGMRQVGVIAAAGIVALTKMVDRIKEDHEKAKMFCEVLRDAGCEINPEDFPTNIVILKVDDAQRFVERLKGNGVLALPISPTEVRFVFHNDVSFEDVKKGGEICAKFLKS